MTNKEIVRDFFVKGYNNHDYAFILSIMTDDYYDHSPASARSAKDAVGILKIVEATFKDMHVEILDLIEEGDKVVGRFLFKGIHVGEYIGVKPTNKQIEWEAIEIFKVVDSKIVESWGYWPDLEIINKLS